MVRIRFIYRGRNVREYRIAPNNELAFQVYSKNYEPTGMEIGVKNIKCRIYDKLREVQYDEEKSIVLQQNRYDDKIPSCATRVEFQIRRDALREFCVDKVCDGIKSWDDYKKARAHLCNYLVTSWLKVFNAPVKNRNHSERLTEKDFLPLW